MTPPDSALAEVVRVEGRRVLATLTRTLGRLDLAEEAVQDASVLALQTWPRTGVPEVPRAWLTTVARRSAIDRIRRDRTRADKERTAGMDHEHLDHVLGSDDDVSVVRDDLLRLVFTCCHPALSIEARVALALRTLVGLEVREVAALLLVSESTMARRLVRARRKIVDARIPYRVPETNELPGRLASVVHVVRLLFTDGHRTSAGPELVRHDRCDEAIRLARVLHDLLPDEGEITALLGLLLVTDARRATRTEVDGSLVALADQDRDGWDRTQIDEGVALASEAWRRADDRPGPVTVEAAIASLHATASSFAATDWRHVARLYALLDEATPSPVIRANRVVAVAEADGAEAALTLLDAYPDQPGAWHSWWVVRAELLHRVGRDHEALADLDRALAMPVSPVESRHLLARREVMSATSFPSTVAPAEPPNVALSTTPPSVCPPSRT